MRFPQTLIDPRRSSPDRSRSPDGLECTAMTQEEIINAAKHLPLTERKALLREVVLNMREDVEV
jgi:hypothetical protein